MDLQRKLEILADAAKYDASCASSGAARKDSRGGKGVGSTGGVGVCHSHTPDGRCVSLLKVLLTNACIYDCHYCINRRSSNVQRARFIPDEVVKITLDFYKRNYLKTIPEASPALIEMAGRYADRISINIELPSEQSIATLAPEKNLARTQEAMGHIRDRWNSTLTPPNPRPRISNPCAPARSERVRGCQPRANRKCGQTPVLSDFRIFSQKPKKPPVARMALGLSEASGLCSMRKSSS